MGKLFDILAALLCAAAIAAFGSIAYRVVTDPAPKCCPAPCHPCHPHQCPDCPCPVH